MGDLRKNFSAWEFECGCGCGANTMSEEILDKLQAMRDDYGASISINSGARCAEHNAKVGGKPDSEHIPDPVTGEAEGVDIKYQGSYQYHRLDFLAHLHFRRVGQADNFIHVGTRASKAQDRTWRYPPKEQKK